MVIKTSMATVLIATCVFSGSACSAEFPERTVDVINPFSAGTGIDIMSRVLAEGMSTQFNRPVVVSSRVGAAGAIGAAYVARAAADGHTILHAPALIHSVLPIMQPNAGYNPRSLVPICQTFENQMSLVVHSSSPFTSVRQLVTSARAEPSRITFGAAAPGTITHLAVAQLSLAAQVEFNHVPFRSDNDLLVQLIGGHIDFGSVTLATAEAAGPSVRILAVFAEHRNPSLPDVPAVKEQGFDIAPTSIGGFFAPIGVPSATMSRLADACKFAAQQQAYKDLARRLHQGENYFAETAVFAARLEQDVEEKARLLRSLGLPK